LFSETSLWELPRPNFSPYSPPLKCQGIKTRLVSWIAQQLRWDGKGRWLEPFLGSGVVLFNVRPPRALVTDSNPHIIAFYHALQKGELSPRMVQTYLLEEGRRLRQYGETHYHVIRERFNRAPNPLDFLFLNRTAFNGIIRFNRKGHFNVPFCQKPERFDRAHITRIVNQVARAQQLLQSHDWQLCHADWRDCLATAKADDFAYLDPPYPGRHTDYYQKWGKTESETLARVLATLPCGYALSMWQSDACRHNPHLSLYTTGMVVRTVPHFYHVGSRPIFRHAVQEALVIKPGFQTPNTVTGSSPESFSVEPAGRRSEKTMEYLEPDTVYGRNKPAGS
jgi:DNA adenine methylase